MSWAITATVGVGILGSIMGSNAQKDAAETSAEAQTQSAQMSIEEAKRQFDAIQKLLDPYVSAGTGAIGQQQDLMGINGTAAQKKAIEALKTSSQFAELAKQGENAMLQNASATGGLRGGNMQAALAQFRPQMLSNLIQQQYQNLGGLTSIGQNAAAGVGNAGMQTSNSIQNALQQAGAAQAGSALASGQAQANMWSNMGGMAALAASMYGSGKF